LSLRSTLRHSKLGQKIHFFLPHVGPLGRSESSAMVLYAYDFQRFRLRPLKSNGSLPITKTHKKIFAPTPKKLHEILVFPCVFLVRHGYVEPRALLSVIEAFGQRNPRSALWLDTRRRELSFRQATAPRRYESGQIVRLLPIY
jgi:hypothetical protein